MKNSIRGDVQLLGHTCGSLWRFLHGSEVSELFKNKASCLRSDQISVIPNIPQRESRNSSESTRENRVTLFRWIKQRIIFPLSSSCTYCLRTMVSDLIQTKSWNDSRFRNEIIRVKQLFKWCEIHFMLLFLLVLYFVLLIRSALAHSSDLVCNYGRT